MTAFLLSVAVSLAINGVFFAVAAARRTDVVTDLSYSLTFALLALALPLRGARSGVQVVAALLVLVWALRLGAYLFRRILRMKVDHRFDEMRDHPLRFARFWILQALTVPLVMAPVTYLVSGHHPPGASILTVIGAVVSLVGTAFEAVADQQKGAFRADESNRGRFIRSGLWRYSRHPNYFGELLVWWGLFLYVVRALDGAAYATLIGPITITVLLLFVSGIPLLEKGSDERYGHDPAYQEYKRRTSVLIPRPPR